MLVVTTAETLPTAAGARFFVSDSLFKRQKFQKSEAALIAISAKNGAIIIEKTPSAML
jgi:hypothetical protein